MARPTETRVRQRLDFAPDTAQSPRLGVFAPLNVNTDDGGARELASALGMVNEVVQREGQQRIQKGAFESTNKGKLDAQLGTVDAKRAAEDQAYDTGVKRVGVERTVIDAFSEWTTQYEQSDELKVAGEDTVAKNFNDFMKQKLGSFTSDPQASQWAFDRIAPMSQKILLEHRATLSAQFKEDTIATAGDMIRSNIASNKPTDPEEIMGVLRPILGKSGATRQYVDMIGALAVENRSPQLLEMLLPEKWADGTPGARAIPALANSINQYRYYAEQAAEGDAREAKKAAADKVEASTVQIAVMATQGDALGAQKQLDAMAMSGLIDRSEYTSLTGFIKGRETDAMETVYDPNAIAAFRVQLLENPEQVNGFAFQQFVARNFPRDRNGAAAAAQLADDWTQARKAATNLKSSSKGRAYRANLTTKHKLPTWASTADQERYAAGVLAFDLDFAETADPESAFAAANKVFESTEIKKAPPTGNPLADAKAFTTGKLDAAAFKKQYDTEAGDAQLKAAHRKGDLSEAEYRQILQLISE